MTLEELQGKVLDTWPQEEAESPAPVELLVPEEIGKLTLAEAFAVLMTPEEWRAYERSVEDPPL
jgi:hypothetical protein